MQVILLVALQPFRVRGHDMINNNDKVLVISSMLNNLKYNIDFLTADINDNPNADIVGKIKREDYLLDFLKQEMALKEELAKLQAN